MTAINLTRGTTISGVLFISMLVSGNSISTIGTNCLFDRNTDVIHSDNAEVYIDGCKSADLKGDALHHTLSVCKTFTPQKGINYSLAGYNVRNATTLRVENVAMNEEKTYNLKKLDQIALLKDGWNGNKAKAFEETLISKARRIITALDIQPELFPTACGSMQLEYEKKDGSYLEIEINMKDTWEVFEITSDESEKYFTIPADAETIIKVVNSFYG